MKRRAHLIFTDDTVTCSACGATLGAKEYQDHIPINHPHPKPAKKKTSFLAKVRAERLRKPTAAERADIRKAIQESKHGNL